MLALLRAIEKSIWWRKRRPAVLVSDISGQPARDHDLDVADGVHVPPPDDGVHRLSNGANGSVLTDDELATWLLLHDVGWINPVNAATAHIVVVQRNVNLRQEPSTSQSPIRLLTPPTEAELLEPEKTAGYYHVKTLDGEEGWIWGRNVLVERRNAPI